MANTPPITASQSGRVAGKFKPNNNPVTTQLKSDIVLSFFTILLKQISDKTHDRIVTNTTNNALIPKLYTPKKVAGKSCK